MLSSTADARQRLTDALAKWDDSSRTARVDRSLWASEHQVAPSALFGRPETLALLQEARSCYVHGQPIGALVLAMSYIEHAIADSLPPRTPARGGMSLKAAIEEARAGHLFPPDLLDRANHLRELRNPYVHRRPFDDERTLGHRFHAARMHPREIQEADAREALEVMWGMLRHQLFGSAQ